MVAFALLWGIVFVQMVTGHDPVLGSAPKASAAGRGGARPRSADGGSDGGEAAAAAAAAESVETTTPDEVEPEYVEPEPVEVEVAEPEPAPVITGQS